MAKSQRIKKTRETPVAKVARQIDLASTHLGDYELADKANYSNDDTRDTYRSGVKQTLRRTTKIDQLHKRGLLGKREAAACEWYHSQHEQTYSCKLKIAQWDAGSTNSDKTFGHWPARRPLTSALTLFERVRIDMTPTDRFVFDRVVLDGRPIGRDRAKFCRIVRDVVASIEGKVELS